MPKTCEGAVVASVNFAYLMVETVDGPAKSKSPADGYIKKG